MGVATFWLQARVQLRQEENGKYELIRFEPIKVSNESPPNGELDSHATHAIKVTLEIPGALFAPIHVTGAVEDLRLKAAYEEMLAEMEKM